MVFELCGFADARGVSVLWSVMLVLILKQMPNNIENANIEIDREGGREIKLGTFGSASL